MSADECCPGGGCGNKQTYGLSPQQNVIPSRSAPTAPKPVEQVATRYPAPNKEKSKTVDPSEWAHRPGNTRQFDSYKTQDPQAGNGQSVPYTYSGANLNAVNFPLGGFGTGQINIQGDGTLGGWTVVNQFHNGEYNGLHKMPSCFFAAQATPAGGTAQSYVLSSPQTYTPENRNLSPDAEAFVSEAQVNRLKTLPGIKSFELVGKYPVANINYDIAGFPVTITNECMTPLIPNDPLASSIPVAQFSFTVSNPSSVATSVKLMQAQQNFVGWNGTDDCTKSPYHAWGGNINTPFSTTGHAGVFMTSQAVATNSPYYGSLVAAGLTEDGTSVKVITSATDETDLFNKFVAGAEVDPTTAPASAPSAAGLSYCAGAVHSFSLAPNESKTVTFILTWHFPNRMRDLSIGGGYDDVLPAVLGNHYATIYRDARFVAQGFCQDISNLVGTTRLYRDTLYGSTIPEVILDSAAGRTAVMRSPTMWWCQNGIVMGNEGNSCCPLNCSHVYGYTMLLERLFPTLGMDMHISAFVRNYNDGVTMRYGHSWAIDGALGTIIKAAINIRQADSDNKFLSKIYPNLKDQMQRILTNFDTQNDGVIRSPQQNTYDTAMNGANTFIGSYYVTALRVTADMATRMGDTAFAATCTARAALSAKNYDAICWKESFGYYIADVNINNCANSYGPGCFVDQICAAGLSCAVGKGYVFNEAHEKSARLAIAKYNQVTMPPFHDMQKHFAPGDTGITVCQYPNGKLGNGMRYDTLVSTGFTSPVVAGFLFDRDTASAEHVAGNIRKRQDGRNRSPWNEPECNILYSRAMAHWNFFDQACGLVYDCTKQYLEYDPRYTPTSFKCFFCAENSWGEFSQTGNAGMSAGSASVNVMRGSLQLKTLKLAFGATGATASVGGQSVPVTFAGGAITFTSLLTIPQGSTLTVTLTSAHSTFEVQPAPLAAIRQRRQCNGSTGCCPDKAALKKQAEAYSAPPTGIVDLHEVIPYPMWLIILAAFMLVGLGMGFGYYLRDGF